jgi:hypothetical protein
LAGNGRSPFEDNQESFLGLMECFAKKADTDVCSQGLPWGRKNNLIDMFQGKDSHPRIATETFYSLVSHNSLLSRY